MTAYADAIAKPPRTLTDLEQKLILKTTGEHLDGFRDHVLISLALGTGLREHELLALDCGDVFGEDGRARRRVALRVFKCSAGRTADAMGVSVQQDTHGRQGDDGALVHHAPPAGLARLCSRDP
jgi:integrase